MDKTRQKQKGFKKYQNIRRTVRTTKQNIQINIVTQILDGVLDAVFISFTSNHVEFVVFSTDQFHTCYHAVPTIQ